MTARADVIDPAIPRLDEDATGPLPRRGVRLEVSTGGFGRHLGARLASERRRSRRPLWVMATRSRGTFTLRDLRDAEAGLLPLDPDTVLHLTDLYGIPPRAALAPTRSGLAVGDGTITAGGVTVVFHAGDPRSMVEAYFRLIRTLRAIDDSTAAVPMRHDDLVELLAHVICDRTDGTERSDGSSTRSTPGLDALERVVTMAGAEGRVVVGSLLAAVDAAGVDEPG